MLFDGMPDLVYDGMFVLSIDGMFDNIFSGVFDGLLIKIAFLMLRYIHGFTADNQLPVWPTTDQRKSCPDRLIGRPDD